MSRGALHCSFCDRRIGAVRLHWLIAGLVYCSRCVDELDLYDLGGLVGTRDAITAVTRRPG